MERQTKERHPLKNINKELYNINNYPGVSGTITVDEQGNTRVPLKFKMVRDGKYVDFSE